MVTEKVVGTGGGWSELKVHEIFTSIQGEGSLVGTPMTFVRLWGCNLQCPWCDTPQPDSDMQVMRVQKVVYEVLMRPAKWVCITGGEPYIQPNVNNLVAKLMHQDLRVAVETNGTRPVATIPDWMCVSPKTDWLEGVLLAASEIKVLVGSGLYDAEEFILTRPELRSKMCLQPVWIETNRFPYYAHLGEAIELCVRYNVRLSVQLHKLLGVK